MKKEILLIVLIIFLSQSVFGGWNVFSPESPPPVYSSYAGPWLGQTNGTVYFNESYFNYTLAVSKNDTHISGSSPWLYDDFWNMYFNQSYLVYYLYLNGIVKTVQGPYLYNDSTNIYFNSSLLNDAIQAGNTEKSAGGYYLYNDSNSIYVNSTRLNETIDDRDTDTDTHIQASGPWLNDDYVNMYFNQTYLGLYLESIGVIDNASGPWLYSINGTLYFNESYFNISFDNRINFTEHWVDEEGDIMTGNLNMSDNNITDIHTIFVHNITGRSPIHINSDLVLFKSENGTPLAYVAPTSYPAYGDDLGDMYMRTLTVDRLIITGLLNYSVTEPPDYWDSDEVWIHEDNFTFYFNDTLLNNTIGQYAIDNNITDTQKYGGGPYLYNDTTTIYVNESKLNNTIIQIADINSYEMDLNVVVSGGVGGAVSAPVNYLITQIIVTPPSTPISYRFRAYETTSGLVIDEDRKAHSGVWNIYKSHSISDTVTVNITNSNIDGNFTVKIKYIDNVIQV